MRAALLPLAVLPDKGKTSEREAVGRWGEQFVYQHLLAKAQEGG